MLRARLCSFYGFSHSEVGRMSIDTVKSYASAQRVIEAEQQLASIQSSIFSKLKKPTREKIIQTLKQTRRKHLKTSDRPATVEEVVRQLQRAGYG